MLVLTFAFAVGFALIHLVIGALHFLETLPRSRWLSGAGGVAVAYVFLHVLPELGAHQETFADALSMTARAAEQLVYLVALAGLAAFYGLERLAQSSRSRSRRAHGEDVVEAEMFWLHIGSFGLYNVLIGYLLLHREVGGTGSLALYGVAVALHFVASDFGLRQDHKHRYDALARWLLAGAVVGGWGLGAVVALSEMAIGFLFAFLAGGMVMNVLKEELPENRQSRFGPFALGAAGYGALLLAV